MDNKGAEFDEKEFHDDVIKVTPDLEAETIIMEDMYDVIGGMGLYQWVLFLSLSLIALFSAETININFIGDSQDHWCNIPRLENMTHEQQKDIAIPFDADGNYEECKMFNLNYSTYDDEDLIHWNRTSRIDNDTDVVECRDGWMYDQSQYINTVTSRLDLVCGDNWMVSLISTLETAGVMVGALTTGLLSDRLGRKPVLVLSCLLNVVVSIMNAFPLNYPWVGVTRFLLGYASLGKYLTGFILLMELVSSSWRSILGVTYGILFCVAFIMWSLLAYFIRDDIRLQLTGYLPTVIFLLFWWVTLPTLLEGTLQKFIFASQMDTICCKRDESPRWLLAKDRYDEAELIVKRIAYINGATLPKNFDIRSVKKEEEKKSRETCLDLFKSPTMRIRSLVTDLHWFTVSLMYYALSLNTRSLPGNVYVNTAISGAVEIPANIIVIFFMNWRITGRRITSSVTLLIAGAASMVSIYMILTDQGMVHTIFSMVAKAFVSMSFSAIYVYSSELFPTEVRNIGVGTASLCARISGMLAPFVGGPLANLWAPLPSLVCGAFSIVSGLLTLLLPETLGHQLFNTLEEAEAFGRDAKVNGPVIKQAVNQHAAEQSEHTYL